MKDEGTYTGLVNSLHVTSSGKGSQEITVNLKGLDRQLKIAVDVKPGLIAAMVAMLQGAYHNETPITVHWVEMRGDCLLTWVNLGELPKPG